LAAARALAHHPRIDVSGVEAAIGARYTYDTVNTCLARCPGVHFVWIMGADNLRSSIAGRNGAASPGWFPDGGGDRLGPSLYATPAPPDRLWRAPHPGAGRKSLARRKPPAWVYLHGLKSAAVLDRAAGHPNRRRCWDFRRRS